MNYRQLGNTGIRVAELGLGTEYLKDVPRETTVSVIREAVDRGVNYIDMFYADPEMRDRCGEALKGRWDDVIFAGHVGAGLRDGKHHRIRDVDECEHYFLDLLKRLRTDCIGVAMVHWFDEEDDFDRHFDDLAALAQRFRSEGKARFIGMSGHKPPLALRAVESGLIDVLMFTVNVTGNAMPGRKQFLAVCQSHGIGLVAMKPYAGGRILRESKTVKVHELISGWKKMEKGAAASITPVKCLSYSLSQIGVSTVVPGPKSLEELEDAFRYLDATDEERDFSSIVTEFDEYHEGDCVYCNHCLPCTAGIDVGQTVRLYETVGGEVTPELRAAYDALPASASECVECGDCMERCPFGVDVISTMKQAANLFE